MGRYSTSYRMNRVFRPDRAALVVPIDHGLVWGRVRQLEAPVQVMKRFLAEDVTGFMVSTGIVKASEVAMAAAPQMARILGIDGRTGSLAEGKDADLALFDGDPFEYTAHVTATVVAGRVFADGPR